jgi:hypothetical protein
VTFLIRSTIQGSSGHHASPERQKDANALVLGLRIASSHYATAVQDVVRVHMLPCPCHLPASLRSRKHPGDAYGHNKRRKKNAKRRKWKSNRDVVRISLEGRWRWVLQISVSGSCFPIQLPPDGALGNPDFNGVLYLPGMALSFESLVSEKEPKGCPRPWTASKYVSCCDHIMSSIRLSWYACSRIACVGRPARFPGPAHHEKG